MRAILKTGLALGALLILSGVQPPTLEAQQCTVRCRCTSGGCGCQSSGGNGITCDASGDGCYVEGCEQTLMMHSADGQTIRLVRSESGSFVATSTAALSPPAWERVDEDGISVARDCRGIVIARYIDRRKAEEMRAALQSITI